MRLNLFVFVLMLLGTTLSGQVQFGVKAFSATNYGGETVKEFVSIAPLQIHKIAATKATSKRGIGLSVYADNAKLFFLGDAQYATSGRTFVLQSVNYSRTLLDPAIEYATQETDLRLSVAGGLKIKNFKLGVGPEFSYALSRSEELSKIDQITAEDENMKAGFNFLLGYNFGRHVQVDLKHTYLFNDITSEFLYNGSPMDMRSNLKYLELSVGLYF